MGKNYNHLLNIRFIMGSDTTSTTGTYDPATAPCNGRPGFCPGDDPKLRDPSYGIQNIHDDDIKVGDIGPGTIIGLQNLNMLNLASLQNLNGAKIAIVTTPAKARAL